jgi:hypothetical protein
VRGTANYFYRRSLRRLTENNGTFNHHHMIRFVKLLKTKKDVILAFEAFYNYLGRNVVMPNSTIDTFMIRAMDLLERDLNKEEVKTEVDREATDNRIVEKILEMWNRHEYLHYFPHYDVTQRMISVFMKRGAE